MNHAGICLDLSVPLQIRLEHLAHLQPDEVDNILECMCSMYNIHPTFLAAQYLQCLILQNHACLRRRIRIAEACDLGRTVLYLLTRIPNPHERIGCIEMFTNPFLKVHAYAVLYTHATIEVRIQIMKNLYRLSVLHADYLRWFATQMRDTTLEYKYRANCADFLLTQIRSKLLEVQPFATYQKEAVQFLQLADTVTGKQLYAHRENVHLFVPRMHILSRILQSGTPRTTPQQIIHFLEERGSNAKMFQQRIFNDKTVLGTGQIRCTLEDLLCIVWTDLSDDMRELLAQDIESSSVLDDPDNEGWMCTTGYYNRILNIYQVTQDEAVFDTAPTAQDKDFMQREAFQEEFTQQLNRALGRIVDEEEKGNIFIALSESSEAERIQYLTFRIHTLSRIIDDLRKQFASLPDDRFTEWVADALRAYEQ